jgi:short-subunit dehydrogenase
MKQKTVIITGASSGIGKALAFEFAAAGANLVLASRNIKLLEEIKAEINKIYSVKIIAVKTDVTIETECKNLVETAHAEFGKIDILINNAGISMRALFKNLDLKVLKQTMDVNFWGTVYTSKYAINHLLESGGSLVAVTSITGFAGLPARTGYAASKYAVHGFMESLRIENMATNLHVMVAAPGYTRSNIRFNALTADGTPQGDTPREEEKMMEPDEVAKKILKGIKKRKPILVMTLQGRIMVLLRKITPRLLDKLTYRAIKREPDSPF